MSADMTISAHGRGTCSVCGRDIALTKKGTVRVHGTRTGWPPENCPGWGKPPKEETS